MSLSYWYHERRIKKLHEIHPEVGIDTIRGDYYARLRGYVGMEL